MHRFLLGLHYVATAPLSVIFILNSTRINPAYRLGFFRKVWLGFRMFYNHFRIKSGTTYKSHLVMALKLFEMPPDLQGVVVECGCWKGASSANLSLACRIVGRKLIVCDSFEGLPEGDPLDREAKNYQKGEYCGQLDEVKANIARYGDIGVCEFRKGWFKDTLPELDEPIVLAFVDVDLEASLHDCVRNIWPLLTEEGYMFIDEFMLVDYCALFFSEKYWKTYFNRSPPGLVGAGTGLALGEYYIGPWDERESHPLQHANAAAYTTKRMSGVWTYFPD